MQFSPPLSINQPHWTAWTAKHSLHVQTIYHYEEYINIESEYWEFWLRAWQGALKSHLCQQVYVYSKEKSFITYWIQPDARRYHRLHGPEPEIWTICNNATAICWWSPDRVFVYFGNRRAHYSLPHAERLTRERAVCGWERYRRRVEPCNQSAAQDGDFRQPRSGFDKWEAQLHADILKIFSDVALPTQWWRVRWGWGRGWC